MVSLLQTSDPPMFATYERECRVFSTVDEVGTTRRLKQVIKGRTCHVETTNAF